MSRSSRFVAIAFTAVAAAILVAAISVPWMIAHGGPNALRWPFRLICHGIESRAFVVSGEPMPLCARCSGFYGGMLLGIVGSIVIARGRSRVPLSFVMVAALPLGIDGLAQASGAWSTPNVPRAATGVLAGAALLCWAIRQIDAATNDASGAVGTALRS